MRAYLVLAAILLPILSQVGSAAERKSDDIVRVYSSLCFHKESGDVLGERVIVLHLPEGDYVQYEESDVMYKKIGGHGPTPSTLSLKVDPTGRAIEFVVSGAEKPEESAIFRGTMSDTMLTGRFLYKDGPKEIEGEWLRLPRVTRTSRGFKDCQ